MPKAPTISVLMPVYNAERYLSTAIQSILAQTFEEFECIIVDDGSSDRSAAIIRQFAHLDSRIRPTLQKNAGISQALNKGLEQAHAPFVARMDADDIAHPQRFQAQYDFLLHHPDHVGCGSWVDFIDPDGDKLFTYHTADDYDIILNELLNGTIGGLIHPAMMLRKEAVITAGKYRPEYDFSEDYDLFTRLTRLGKLSNLQASLLSYRQHLGSINATSPIQRRIENKNKLTNAFRKEHGLEPIKLTASQPTPFSSRIRWIELSLIGGELKTVNKHTQALLKTSPLHIVTWKTTAKVVRAHLEYSLRRLKHKRQME